MTNFHYVVDWQAKQAGLDAADLHWDFIFGDTISSLDTLWINVRRDSDTNEWVVTPTENRSISVTQILSGAQALDDSPNGELRFTFNAEDGTNGVTIVSDTTINNYWYALTDFWSYNSSTGELKIVFETTEDDWYINPDTGGEFINVVNVQDGALERGQEYGVARKSYFALEPPAVANAGLIGLLDAAPTPTEGADAHGLTNFVNQFEGEVVGGDEYRGLGTLKLGTAWTRDEAGAETYYGVIGWSTSDWLYGDNESDLRWVVLTSAPDAARTTWALIRASPGESSEPTTFKYYQHTLDYTIEDLLNGAADLDLEGDANTRKMEWTFSAEDGSVNGQVSDQDGSFEGEWIPRPDLMTYDVNAPEITWLFSRPADANGMDSSPGYIFPAAA